MSKVIESLERDQARRVPRFQAGDRLKVHFQVVEGTRRRTQVFEGVVIKRQGTGSRETFTVRKSSFGVGVERTFPLHSPKIDKIEVASRGDVRRAKLYYLRDRVGKSARVRERQYGGSPEEIAYVEPEGAFDEQGAQAEAEVLPADEAAPETEGDGATADAAAGADAPAAEDGAPEAEAPEAETESPGPEAEADAPDEAADAPEDGSGAEAGDAPAEPEAAAGDE